YTGPRQGSNKGSRRRRPAGERTPQGCTRPGTNSSAGAGASPAGAIEERIPVSGVDQGSKPPERSRGVGYRYGQNAEGWIQSVFNIDRSRSDKSDVRI